MVAKRQKTTTEKSEVVTTPDQNTEVDKSESKKTLILSHCNLYDSYAKIRFSKETYIEVETITSWMQCQIDAGHLEVISDPKN